VIRLDRVTKVYATGSRPALVDVSVEVDRGEFVCLIGASGCGKSTLLRIVAGFETPTRGQALMCVDRPTEPDPSRPDPLSGGIRRPRRSQLHRGAAVGSSR